MGTQPFTQEQKDEFFEDILRLYDLTDEVVNAIGAPGVTNRAAQLEIATPLLTQAGLTNDIVTRIYTEIVKNGEPVTDERKAALEEAFPQCTGTKALYR